MRQGGRKAISFTLTCTNWFQDETFDAAIYDGYGMIQPIVFRQLTLQANSSLIFDYDKIEWNWCNGDTFAILDKNGRPTSDAWTLNLKVYAPGECPECHGSHRCRQCGGRGHYTNRHTHTVEYCSACNGSGICQTCYVPIRNASQQQMGIPDMGGGNPASSFANASRQREVSMLRGQIKEYESRIEKVDWDLRMMELKGSTVSSRSTYRTYLDQKYRYEKKLIELQSRLEQLESMY